MQVEALLCQNRVLTIMQKANQWGGIGFKWYIFQFWGHIWKLWVPNKVKIFLWCACTEALPTKLILQKWKVLDNPSCSLYQLASQNTLDDLWSYAHLHLVWDIAFFGVWCDYPQLASFSDLVRIISQEPRNLELFAMVAWSVWLRRNKLCCNEPNLPIQKIFEATTALFSEFQRGAVWEFRSQS